VGINTEFMKPVYYTDEEYQEILEGVEQLTREAEELPYPQAKELVQSLLQYLDVMHREALARLTASIRKAHPGLEEKIHSDFAAGTLFSLYDLLESGESRRRASRMGFVPLEEVGILTPVRQTTWCEAGQLANFDEEQLYAKELGGANVLIVKIDEHLYALQNACIDSALPMQFGHLEGHHLICPWHGCRYDLTTGALLDQPGKEIHSYPVRMAPDGSFQVGITK